MALSTEKFKEQEYSGATKTVMDIADLRNRMDATISHADLFLPEATQRLKEAREIINTLVEELYGSHDDAQMVY